MNRKERAINLGLKINSLKGNMSVANSVIEDLESEIKTAVIDEEDRSRLLVLYKNIVDDLKKTVSPSTKERAKINQEIENILSDIKNANSYLAVEKTEGIITSLEEKVQKSTIMKKEHSAALRNRLKRVRDKYNNRIGFFLKKNFDNLKREIKKECNQENPFYISVNVKKYNEKVKITPLFSDDRHSLQAMLDTLWQQSSRQIKEIKQSDSAEKNNK